MGSTCPNARLKGLNKNRERKGERGSTPRASSGAPSHGHQEQCVIAATATSGEAGRAERGPHATEDSDQLAMHDQRAVAKSWSRAQARDARSRNPNPNKVDDEDVPTISKASRLGQPAGASSTWAESEAESKAKVASLEGHYFKRGQTRSTLPIAAGPLAPSGSVSGALEATRHGQPADLVLASAEAEYLGKTKISLNTKEPLRQV